jgi:HK97 family phage portal protein
MTMEVKTVVNIPWASNENSWRGVFRVNTTSDAYTIPLVHRALNIRCDTLLSVPRYIYRGEDEINEYEFEESLPIDKLLWLTEAAYLLVGAGWVLKQANQYGFKKGLRWLNPYSVKYEIKGEELRFWQEDPNSGKKYPASGYWTKEDFLYFKGFNPLDDLGPGISAAQSALTGAQIMGNTSTFLSKFFESDALPVTMLMMPQGTQPTEISRVEGWFKRKLRGMTRGLSERVLGVTGDVKLERLTSELSSFDFDKIDNHSISQVAWAFGIPKTVLTADSANRATAETEYGTFLSNTIVPRCRFYESILNPFLEEFGQRLEFAPEEMSALQEDETARATALKALVDAGTPLVAALDILGYDLSDDAQAAIDKMLADKEKAKLIVPPPQAPSSAIPSSPLPAEPPKPEIPPTKMELDRWLRKALKSLKSGGPALVEFQSEIIPEDIQTSLIGSLVNATTAEEVKSIFAKVA